MALWPLCCVMLLAGCSRVERVPIAPEVSPALLVCADAPAKPTGSYTQKDVARFVTKLGAAHQDCKGNLASVRSVLEDFHARQK